MLTSFTSIPECLEHIRQGKRVILVDNENRENEGDVIVAAEHVTPEIINFMITHARGLVCLSLAPAIVDQLQLPMMVAENRSRFGTAFTVSIEAATGVTTGISAQDRARTIQVAVDRASTPDDLVMPGHVFPLRAAPGGVLERPGHTEGSVDLARLAGLRPAAVICEILAEDGQIARLPYLQQLSQKYGLPIVRIDDLIAYRQVHDNEGHFHVNNCR